ncbi:hypothetical protein Dsin_015755 [Dipteronia sinensis]|uniref:Uncharacterized protein n=1 Tax=Dipteronia sinensis TaxID=43782 RepID=A0AAE0AC44_9ROSI|nr:hypothetical protein Dsin_015755 [Dipteronia sinensis]
MTTLKTDTMITTTTTTATKPPRKKSVCFSFAAYAKTLLEHLESLNIPILEGLNDVEFADIESSFNFTFPPDLRCILQVGLPVGPSFPNWRSSSKQQLRILLSLPSLYLSKNISLNNFWSDSWGQKPQNMNMNDHVLSFVKQMVDKAPVLVPIYRNCYIPATPNMAGNPVFYIDVEEVKVLSFDVAGFFKQVDFFQVVGGGVFKPLHMPAWAAKEARRIRFWTAVAERGRAVTAARGDTRCWWSSGGDGLGLKCCLEEVILSLRDGGWREEEVREMMMMDGCDDDNKIKGKEGVQFHKKGVIWHVRFLSGLLLNAGWSREDVVYSLNLQDHENINGGDHLVENSTYLEFEHPSGRFSNQKNERACSNTNFIL